MQDHEIENIGDLIKFLSQFDPNKKIVIWDNELTVEKPLQGIDIELNRIVIYY